MVLASAAPPSNWAPAPTSACATHASGCLLACRFEEVATTDGATGSAPQQGQEAVQAGVSGVQHTAGAEVHGQNATS